MENPQGKLRAGARKSIGGQRLGEREEGYGQRRAERNKLEEGGRVWDKMRGNGSGKGERRWRKRENWEERGSGGGGRERRGEELLEAKNWRLKWAEWEAGDWRLKAGKRVGSAALNSRWIRSICLLIRAATNPKRPKLADGSIVEGLLGARAAAVDADAGLWGAAPPAAVTAAAPAAAT